MPHFDYHGIMCRMAGFKAHCVFGFWNESSVAGSDTEAQEAMGQFGRITSLADLPAREVLVSYVRKAAELKDAGVKPPARVRSISKEIAVPDYFATALEKNSRAKATFDGFSYSCRKEYVEWIIGAKRDATREQRIATAIEWLQAGKQHNWRYLKK